MADRPNDRLRPDDKKEEGGEAAVVRFETPEMDVYVAREKSPRIPNVKTRGQGARWKREMRQSEGRSVCACNKVCACNTVSTCRCVSNTGGGGGGGGRICTCVPVRY